MPTRVVSSTYEIEGACLGYRSTPLGPVSRDAKKIHPTSVRVYNRMVCYCYNHCWVVKPVRKGQGRATERNRRLGTEPTSVIGCTESASESSNSLKTQAAELTAKICRARKLV